MNYILHNIPSIETKISFIILLVFPSILANGINYYLVKAVWWCGGGEQYESFIPSSMIIFKNIWQHFLNYYWNGSVMGFSHYKVSKDYWNCRHKNSIT